MNTNNLLTLVKKNAPRMNNGKGTERVRLSTNLMRYVDEMSWITTNNMVHFLALNSGKVVIL